MKHLQTHQGFCTCTYYSKLFDERYVQTCLTAHGSSTNHLMWPSLKSSTFTYCQGICQLHHSFQPWFLRAEKRETFPERSNKEEDQQDTLLWDKIQTTKAGFKFTNIFILSCPKYQERHKPDQWTAWKTSTHIFSSRSQKVIAFAYMRVILLAVEYPSPWFHIW